MTNCCNSDIFSNHLPNTLYYNIKAKRIFLTLLAKGFPIITNKHAISDVRTPNYCRFAYHIFAQYFLRIEGIDQQLGLVTVQRI